MSNLTGIKLKLKNPHLQDLEWLEEQISKIPESKITSNVVDTAEKVRVLPSTSPFPGKYSFRKSPYMYEIAMNLSPQSAVEIINIAKMGQGGATAGSSENLILFKIAEDPGPVLAMVPTNEYLKKWDETRLMPMIDASGLKGKLKSSYKKNSQHGGGGDAIGRKSWVGGKLDIITFAQLNQLRNQSYQIIIIDDAEELVMTSQRGSGQGNVKKVAFIRSNSFTGRRKILDISTPISLMNSHIWKEFLKGTQKYYYINCTECGFSQRLEWQYLKYTKNEHNHVIEDSVYYECQNPDCDHHLKEEEKPDFLMCKELGGTAKWVAHNAEKAEPLTESYQFSALYAMPGFDSWYQLAKEWVQAQNNPEDMQAFYNLRLGLPFDDRADAPPATICHSLKGTYKRGTIPNTEEGSVIFSVLACDVQAGNKRDGKWVKNKEARIEASLWGYGLNGRSWLIDHYIISGETTDHRSGSFKKLKEMIIKDVFPIPPERIFIDSGYQTDQVRQFCNGGDNIHPIMGGSTYKKGYFSKTELAGFQSGSGLPLVSYELNTTPIKTSIYNSLKLSIDPLTGDYPQGYRMFPTDIEGKFFDQLVAETPVIEEKNGRKVIKYVAHGANETLDTTCYAECAKLSYIHDISILNGQEASNHQKFWEWAINEKGFYKVTPHELAIKQQNLHRILYN